jgi:predicted lysophospholipase L1 biosynthesis ABC-type transport system permease subunit
MGVFRGERRPGATGVAREIVGVVDDTRDLGPIRPLRRTVYLPEAGVSSIGGNGIPSFLIRTSDQLTFDTLRRAMREVEPSLPDPAIATLEQRLGDRLARDRFSSLLMVLFAWVALLLTAIGVYGVVSWVVRHSTQEIGIRVALGASRARVAAGILRRGLLPVVAGLVAGGVASMLLSRLVATLMSVPVTAGLSVPLVAGAVLLAAALLAAALPARRALRVDPVEALRLD